MRCMSVRTCSLPPQIRRGAVQICRATSAGEQVTFLINNFCLKPQLIADLYPKRWQVELLSNWIKQHLRIKVFFGTSENAVKTQIWIAICTYVLIAIARKRLHLEDHSMYEILQILSLSMFEKSPIHQLLTKNPIRSEADLRSNQLDLV
jgi:IS4 transposase